MSEISDLRTFARVVERGGFAAASSDLGITASGVSKLVTRLEDRLGVRLLHRTTRRVAPTSEGETYYLRARDIIAAIDDADAEVSQAGRQPHGRLRVNCVPAFAFHQLMPALPEFVARYPAVQLDFAITDRVIDLLEENADVGIRTGPTHDASLVVRKFGEVRRGLFASPDYLARRGAPRTSDQLRDHKCIVVTLSPAPHRWSFRDGTKVRSVEIANPILVDSGEAASRLAIAGGGITRLADLAVATAVRDGQLEPLLTETYLIESSPLCAVYPNGKQRMPKVRAFLDFLVERFSDGSWRKALPRQSAHHQQKET